MTFLEFYQSRIKVHSITDDEIRGYCPFHDDDKMSFSANLKTGLWNCFAGCSGGDSIQFYAKLMNCSLVTAKNKLDKMGIVAVIEDESRKKDNTIKLVPNKEIAEFHDMLLRSKEVLGILEKRGISLSTIKRFSLGYDGDRLWIPVRQGRHFINVRKHDIHHKQHDGAKVISYKSGYGELRLFPEENLTGGKILLLEGEMDCLLGCELGYNAITVTGGAGSFKKEFIQLFKDKEVAICYDRDKAGQEGAKSVYSKISRICKTTRIIKLPGEVPAGYDFTDYIRENGKESFEKLLQNDKISKDEKVDEKVKDNPVQVSLDEASSDKYFFKDIEMNVMISGKDLAPYFVPKKVLVSCHMGRKVCKFCPLGVDGKKEVEFTKKDPELLAMINCTQDQQKGVIRKKAGILECHVYDIDVKEVMNIEEVRVIPEIDFSAQDREYVTRQLFSIGPSLHTNRSYKLKGITIPNPHNQYATQIIYDAKPTQDSIDQFAVTKEVKKELEIFQPGKLTIAEKLREIYDDFTYNITHIYHRNDVLMAIDLVYHSVLRFRFMNRVVQRGWTECLILGDTRSGKTESISSIINHYRAGELCTGENASFAGLIGGMQQAQDKWVISWGKIPLNDRRLVVIDEAGGLTLEHISSMSGARSSGIAEIVKIQTEKTNARTRLIWLSNPRSGRKLDAYNHGVLAIRELMGRVEDIARLDFALTCASGEVDQKEIHQLSPPKIPHKYTTNLCNKLVLWAWSRKTEQIVFEPEATKRILEASQEMGAKYSSAIPLVEPAEQRIKLARLSAALACRLFSTDDGQKVLVTEEHILAIVDFLRAAYSKPSMGYDLFSGGQAKTVILDDKTMARLKKEFGVFPSWVELRDLFLEYQTFRRNEFIEQIGYDQEEAKRLFHWCGKNRLIRSTAIGYFKQPVFTEFLKGLLKDEDKKEFTKRKEKF